MIKRYNPDVELDFNEDHQCYDEHVGVMIESPDGQYAAYADAHNLANFLAKCVDTLAADCPCTEEIDDIIEESCKALGYKNYHEFNKSLSKE